MASQEILCHVVFPTDGPHPSVIVLPSLDVEAWLVRWWDFLLRRRMPQPMCPVLLVFALASFCRVNQKATADDLRLKSIR